MKLHHLVSVSSIFSQLILGGAAAVDNTILKKHHHSGESLGECYHILLEGYKECDIQCGIEMPCSDSAEFETDMAECESCTRGAEMQYEECVTVCFDDHPETYAPAVTAPNKNVPRVPFLSKILSGETTLASAEKRLQSVKGVESSVKSVARDLVVARIEGTDDGNSTNFSECYREVVSGYEDCKDVCGECPECDLENDEFWTCSFGCVGCTVQAEVRMFGCILDCIDIDDDDDTGKSGVDDDGDYGDDDTNGKSGVEDDDTDDGESQDDDKDDDDDDGESDEDDDDDDTDLP